MTAELRALIFREYGHSVHRLTQIQPLWNNYGGIYRCTFRNNEPAIIVKCIQIPEQPHAHPYGWNSSAGHLRKITSYTVEQAFYENYATDIPVRVPQFMQSVNSPIGQLLFMEDLAVNEFVSPQAPSYSQIIHTIEWLAQFHAYTLGKPFPHLWPQGNYWHLDTRQEEWERISSSTLKTQAGAIDAQLKHSAYTCLIHGDAKHPNFLYNDTDVAAIDFQYSGTGVGVMDLVCYFSSIMDASSCFKWESQLRSHYFKALSTYIQQYSPHISPVALKQDWEEKYIFAWADYYRFLQGWNPSHPKNRAYAAEMSQKALTLLSD